MIKKLAIIFVLAVVALPTLALAAPGLPYWPGTNGRGILSCTGNYLNDPYACRNFCDVLATGQNVIYFGITLALFVIFPIVFLWGGARIMMAGGSPQRVTAGRSIITNALIGIGITLGAFLIVNTFLWAIGAATNGQGLGGVAWPNIECRASPLFPDISFPASTGSTGSNPIRQQ